MTMTRPALVQLARYGVVGVVTNLAGYLVYLFLTWFWLEPKLAVSILYPVGGNFKLLIDTFGK